MSDASAIEADKPAHSGRGRRPNNFAADDPAVLACKRALAAVGDHRQLARLLTNISPDAVRVWVVVPAERVRAVERLTGVSRYELRPDVFGPADELYRPDRSFAVSAQIALKSQALADAIGVPLDEIAQWDTIPAELVLKIEKHTGISRHQLRPDVFGQAPDGEVAA